VTDIHTLLIANRGEIARRIIRTAREMGIRTVAVFSDPDRLAPHVLEADVAVPLGGLTAADSYMNRDELLKAADWQGADAIHPGYGFLSENAAFARTVVASGRVWVGPPPDVIATMGDKIVAKQAAADSGLPTLPSAVLAPDERSRWPEQVAEIGYPVMIKAAAGGGGRGMRLVDGPDALSEAVDAAEREAIAIVDDRRLFAELYLVAARHIEVQVIADIHGTVVHLGERECSIQRRHQKIIEEAPSTAITPALRARLGEAAVELATTIGYTGAGTVEFLLDDSAGRPSGDASSDDFYFLEMNTRLQVEHAVTEAICGLDLVRLQLLVAMGEPLGFEQEDLTFEGHAIEARLYAEDPARGWMPSTGTIHRWRRGTTPAVRYDDGVVTGSIVSPYYDPMLAKVIAHAPTRREAAGRLSRSLREMQIHGVTTNRDYLVEVLRDADFLDGDTHTDFVTRHPPAATEITRSDATDGEASTNYEREWHRFNTVLGPHLAAAALYRQRTTAWRSNDHAWPFAPSGWRNVAGRVKELRPLGATWRLADSQVGSAPQSTSFIIGETRWDVEYARVSRDHSLAARRRAEGGPGAPIDLFNVAIQGPGGQSTTLVEVIDLHGQSGYITPVAGDPDDVELLVHFGRRGHHCLIHTVDDVVYVNSPLGQSELHPVPRFVEPTAGSAAAGPVSPLPGRVVSVEVGVGDIVEAGQPLVVLEAMKVEHTVSSPAAGRVAAVLVQPGDTIAAHQLLVRLDAPETDPIPESSHV
jgi:propionyl-CoA carboxylase alpha chain